MYCGNCKTRMTMCCIMEVLVKMFSTMPQSIINVICVFGVLEQLVKTRVGDWYEKAEDDYRNQVIKHDLNILKRQLWQTKWDLIEIPINILMDTALKITNKVDEVKIRHNPGISVNNTEKYIAYQLFLRHVLMNKPKETEIITVGSTYST